MKIGSWRVVKDVPYGPVEWFNPASRMRIEIEQLDISHTWSVFIYRERKSPPKSGRAPTSFITFRDRGGAIDYAQALMKRESLSFSDLESDSKNRKSESIAYLKNFLKEWLLKTAHMKLIGPDTYEWGRVIIKAYFHIEADVYFYYKLEPAGPFSFLKDKYGIVRTVHLGPWVNYSAAKYEADKDWLAEHLDDKAKKLVHYIMTYDIVKEEVGMRAGKPLEVKAPDLSDKSIALSAKLRAIERIGNHVRERTDYYKKIVDEWEEVYESLEKGELPKGYKPSKPKPSIDPDWLRDAKLKKDLLSYEERVDRQMKGDSDAITKMLSDFSMMIPALRKLGQGIKADSLYRSFNASRALYELASSMGLPGDAFRIAL
jgi:hypothetical protein